MKKQVSGRQNKPQPEICVTIHYAEKGPGLESRMVSILSAHLSKNEKR